ncbi:MAG TPA: MgtC/SapB family protein [Clostridiaceae bacterium]|nr:MgtC/SapB family protein [Clostridiaceae bacterium]
MLFSFDRILYLLDVLGRLLLALLLGGIIGYERESENRPAGFRTHILVCMGAALVMITSEFIYKELVPGNDIDLTRMGAQVISGIGFLGAGTILREGFNVKGLTTAASLWAVSCVGLAVGIGFIEGAIFATILVYITLILLKKIERQFNVKKQYKNIFIEAEANPDIVFKLTNIFSKYQVLIKNIEYINSENENRVILKFNVRPPHAFRLEDIMLDICNVEGVCKAYEKR